MTLPIYDRFENATRHSAKEQAYLDTRTRMYHDLLFKFDASLIDTYISAAPAQLCRCDRALKRTVSPVACGITSRAPLIRSIRGSSSS